MWMLFPREGGTLFLILNSVLGADTSFRRAECENGKKRQFVIEKSDKHSQPGDQSQPRP